MSKKEMSELEYKQEVIHWCDYFLKCPWTKLYYLGDYAKYKEYLETYNDFLADDDNKVKIDDETLFNAKSKLLKDLIAAGYLTTKKEN